MMINRKFLIIHFILAIGLSLALANAITTLNFNYGQRKNGKFHFQLSQLVRVKILINSFYTGDSLLKSFSDSKDWTTAHQSTEIIRFPPSGTGPIINRFDLKIDTVNV